MLVEIYSPVFKEKGKIRAPIVFKNGLNVVLGTQTASNSIGKSSSLLAIDFAFGGDTYLNSDGVRNIGNHTIYSCFKFDKKYYYGRSTEFVIPITLKQKKLFRRKIFSTFLWKIISTTKLILHLDN